MKLIIDDSKFLSDINGILNYSTGFIDGVKSGKSKFLDIMGSQVKNVLNDFIDVNARMSPESLSHVYEWYRAGSPDARLYNISYSVNELGLSFNYTFSQSQAIKSGSKVPFYNKADIMENGIPVSIKPREATVLSFNANGQQVFTKKEITVENPGGPQAQGGFEKTFNNFFDRYFAQSFLLSSGIIKYLENPVAYKNNMSSGKISGSAIGFQTGYRWIINAGVLTNV